MKKIVFFTIAFTCMAISVFSIQTSLAKEPSKSTAKEPLYWVDPMEPEAHYDKSGKSKMGMELKPVYMEKKTKESDSNSGY